MFYIPSKSGVYIVHFSTSQFTATLPALSSHLMWQADTVSDSAALQTLAHRTSTAAFLKITGNGTELDVFWQNR